MSRLGPETAPSTSNATVIKARTVVRTQSKKPNAKDLNKRKEGRSNNNVVLNGSHEPKNEQPDSPIGPCPSGRGAEFERVWNELMHSVNKVLSSRDRLAVIMFVEDTIQANQMQAIVDKDGMVQYCDNGKMNQHPLLPGIRLIRGRLARQLEQFAATPATRFKAPENPEGTIADVANELLDS